MTDARTRSKVIMGNFFTRIRERSFVLALTVAAVLTFGALAAAPATAVESAWPSASISGTVVGAGAVSAPLAVGSFVKAYVLTEEGSYVLDAWRAQIDASGAFTLVGLPAGVYKLGVDNRDVGSLWGSLPMNESDGVSKLTSVVVNADQAVAGQELILPRLLTISGIVLGDLKTDESSDDTPLANSTVNAYSDNSWMPTMPVATATTDVDGKYTLRGLPTGNYAVSFQNYYTSTGLAYETEYWDDKPAIETSNRIDVVAGTDIIGIDATLAALDQVTTGVPTIVGSAIVGQVLTAEPGVWGPNEVDFDYAWQRNGQYFYSESNSKTYTVTADDIGHVLRVQVVGNKSGYQSLEAFAAGTTLVQETSEPAPSPKPSPTPSATPTPTTVPATELAQTEGPIPASVVGAKSDRVTTPTATLVVGASIPVSGEGFAPFEVVDIWLHSTPVLLGTLTADAQGRISGSFAMPSGLPTGIHHVVLVDEAGVSYTSADLVVTTTATLASTGSDLSSGWFALSLMVLGGLALTVTARRRTASALK
jgi:uncharacterized membrane protein (DUF485 family)